MNNFTLTNAELRLLIILLGLDPGGLGLTNAQIVTARNLLKKFKGQK
jgi:hypothetical protein